MEKAGITQMPKTWDEVPGGHGQAQGCGRGTFATGSKNRWPAQYWFDYLRNTHRGA